MNRLFKTSNLPALLIRMVVGITFVSEGTQKFIRPDEVGAGRFAKIGFANPVFWAHFTGTFEITCGLLVLIGLLTRLAIVPLFIIMIVAFVTTKYPILASQGFWAMAHEYRTDFALTLLLVFLLIHGGGKFSLDLIIYNAKKTLRE